ncbi:E3 ubiquitin-protein ligase CHFR-like [Liolophura sinensis]|uniref:E3 ubiquitin-protein ligase CHFR-like n=1 Tax=Liolophura sinensis TaxID=3198878 RepID=UPI0031588C76
MSSDAKDIPWGQLVSITDLFSEPVEICKKKFTIGRAKGCDLSFPANKLVSSSHCYIERDEDDKVWLRDTSTNGTLLRNTEKILNQRRHLEHGDEFYLVYKKNHQELNIGYVFQDMEALRNEDDDSTLSYSERVDSTLPDADVHKAISLKPDGPEEGTSESPCSVMKKRKIDETSSNQASTSGARDGYHGNKEGSCQEKAGQTQVKNQDMYKVEKSETKDEKPETNDEKAETNDEKAETKDEKSEIQDEKEEAKHGKAETEVEKSDIKDEKTDSKPSAGDAIAESLVCIICQEILHNCISLQPCLHSFCAGCYSDWMDRSNECPSCRMKVQRINKNHMVVNLVEAYLREHPDKKRPEEDLKELDAKNKITRDMLYPKTLQRRSDDSEEGDYEHDSEAYSDDGTPDVFPSRLEVAGNMMGRALYDLGATIHGRVHPPATMCRQCPGYVEPKASRTNTPGDGSGANSGETTAATSNTATTSAQPSTSGTTSTNQDPDDNNKILPTPPPYQCGVNSTHVLCTCCYQVMPDRRSAHRTNPAVPPMSCLICYRNYCHAYWGCRKADCRGCFNKFKDMNFGKKCLGNLLLDNPYESKVLADYLNARSISVRDVLQICLERMERGEYICEDQYRYRLSSSTYMCYSCALRNFRDLAYYYRRDIPRHQLPDAVTSRPDCYWGKDCHTQKHKPHHAERFNHICDGTRQT